MNWKIKKVKVAQLKEWDKNPRNLTAKGLADLKLSIERFGIAEPLVCNTDLTLIGGHGRKKVLQEMNIKEVDCYIPDVKLTQKQCEELGIRLNKNIAGDWNFDILANEFELPDLLEYGFEEKDFGITGDESNGQGGESESNNSDITCPNCGTKLEVTKTFKIKLD